MLFCLLLAGCGDIPQPFRHDGPNPALIPAAARGVLVPPLDDSEPAARLAGAVVKRLQEGDIPASVRPVVPGAWVLVAGAETGDAAIRLHWRLLDGDVELGRLDQTLPREVWVKADAKSLDALAGVVVDRLSAPLAGGSLPASQQSPAADIRPTLRLIPPSGLPGDGDKALAAAMRRLLEASGARVVDTGDAQFQIKGQATLGPGKAGQDNLAVAWTVLDTTGQPLGTASQQGDVPKGRLAGAWGSLAADIAGGGAEGVVQILRAAMR